MGPGPAKKTARAAGPSSRDRAELREVLGLLGPRLAPHLENLGLELVDVGLAASGHGLVARFTIDKPWAGDAPGGSRSPVTLDDCAAVSRTISILLDELDPGPGPGYMLEVSSPGLDRPLRGQADFERFRGSLVKLRLNRDGKSSRHTGRLELGPLRLVTGQGEVPFSLDMVVSAWLVPEI
ncbi:MAG: ribosome maturation factor RimP [Deltaproteobacteria bacterium]|nr:ribosome maturation factor RimP [Deltaproteobacteria bacterium]